MSDATGNAEITPSSRQVLVALRRRLFEKADALNEMATKEADGERRRLRAKASGVTLAMSFVDDAIRGVDL